MRLANGVRARQRAGRLGRRKAGRPRADRDRRRVDSGHHGALESTQLATHLDALKAAGFAEIGTLWHRGDNRLLCAVLPQS